jgi:hypothetical protein
MKQKTIVISSEQLSAMRDWVSECVWLDIEPEDVAELTERQIVQGIERHYVGGVEAFLEDMGV